MNIQDIHDTFKDISEAVPGIQSFAFGWPFDRVRGNDPESGTEALFPRVFFAVPTATQDTVRQQDTYTVQLFFDGLQGYGNDGETTSATQLGQWAALQSLAALWVQEFRSRHLERATNAMAVTGTVTQGFDSFTGAQRMATVTLTFQITVTAACS